MKLVTDLKILPRLSITIDNLAATGDKHIFSELLPSVYTPSIAGFGNDNFT